MAKIYGIAWATQVRECSGLMAAHCEARAAVAAGEPEVSVVELGGVGPVFASDGERIAETHAPERTIRTYRRTPEDIRAMVARDHQQDHTSNRRRLAAALARRVRPRGARPDVGRILWQRALPGRQG